MHGFHLRDGAYFKRMQDGSVRIRLTETAHADAPVIREITVPESEWASVVASVCHAGETSATWRAALELHTAPAPTPAPPTHMYAGAETPPR